MSTCISLCSYAFVNLSFYGYVFLCRCIWMCKCLCLFCLFTSSIACILRRVNETAINVVPSFDGGLRRPSSCPNADDNFDGCETNFKHDLHSFLDFSNIVEKTSSH